MLACGVYMTTKDSENPFNLRVRAQLLSGTRLLRFDLICVPTCVCTSNACSGETERKCSLT